MPHTDTLPEAPIDPPAKSQRIITLDYLRGLFIVIIIIDHVWRWPNLFQYISGRGEMWTSAAEGFVMISGLLVGYVHGYKKRHQPLRPIAGKLLRRGLVLYIWTVLCTIIFAASVWLLTSPDTTVLSTPLVRGDWWQLITSALTLSYISTWTHFLYFYAFCLMVAPAVILLLRKNKLLIILALSLIGWYVGYINSIEWLQWQLVFFAATVIGYYFGIILQRYRQLPARPRFLARWAPVALFAITFIWSLTIVFQSPPGTPSGGVFDQNPLSLPTILLSFIWFAGLLSLFHAMAPKFPTWLRHLLLTLGERSLTSYIVHIVPLIGCALLFTVSENIIINTIIVAIAIHATWGLMKIPHLNRVVPR